MDLEEEQHLKLVLVLMDYIHNLEQQRGEMGRFHMIVHHQIHQADQDHC